MQLAMMLVTAILAQASPSPRVLALDQSRSTLGYTVVHKLHQASAVSKTVEGKVALLANGKMQIMVRAPVTSFRSGDGNLDEHMFEVMEVGKYPQVVFKAAAAFVPPATTPATINLSLTGELDFHGQKSMEIIPLKIEFVSDKEARVTTKFLVSLEKYKIERPSFLLVKLDDTCQIDVNLTLKEEAK